MKTTSFEISKRLKEIGFCKNSDNYQFYYHDNELYCTDLNLESDTVLSYDLETIIEALPNKLLNENYLLSARKNEVGYFQSDDEGEDCFYGLDREESESLADTAAKLLLILHEKGLINFTEGNHD